jgi:hypothetical protein
MYIDNNTRNWYETPVAISPFSLPGASGNLSIPDGPLGERRDINDVFLFLNFSLNEIRE